MPGVVFLYSLRPAAGTGLSVALAERPVLWNGYKINVAVMAAFRPEHRRYVLRLLHLLYREELDAEQIRKIRSRDDFLACFLSG